MVRPLLLCAVVAALPLAGCHDREKGTSISINAGDAGGNVAAVANGATGEVSLNLPGFSGTLKLPKIHLDGDDLDMNGVHLYPGSKITAMNVDAGGKDNAVVHVGFDSPADPATVRGWLNKRLTDAGFQLHEEGAGLAGTTDDGKPFRLELAPAGDGHSTGQIAISG